MDVQVAVMNASWADKDGGKVVTDDQVKAVAAVLQKQVSEDFRPAWGLDAAITFVPTGEKPPPGTWWLTILDTADQAEALGYHELTPEGLPLGKVFAGTAMVDQREWTMTASHELLEMLVDPNANTAAYRHEPEGLVLYALEVADPCEADQYGYLIDGIRVSDFLTPAWFKDIFAKVPGTPFDRERKISKPFEVLPGGYRQVYRVQTNSGWLREVPGQPDPTPAPRGRRTARRELGHHRWGRSRPETQDGTGMWQLAGVAPS